MQEGRIKEFNVNPELVITYRESFGELYCLVKK